MLTREEALARAVTGDTQAIFTIIQQQRAGEWLRLYPFGRKGPRDEGYVPFLYGMALGRICLIVGRPAHTLQLNRDLTTSLLVTSHKFLNAFVDGCGGDKDVFNSQRAELLRGRTKRLVIGCSAGDDLLKITLEPRGRLMSLAYSDCLRVVSTALCACRELGWSFEELGVDEIVDELEAFCESRIF